MNTRPMLIQPGMLLVGVDASPPPPLHSGHPGEGFEVDLVLEMAQRLGLTPKYKSALWSEILALLTSGQLDIICTAATVTEERRKVVDFSQPYFDVQLAIVTRQDFPVRELAELRGRPIGVRLGTTAEQFLSRWPAAGAVSRFHMNVDAYCGLQAGEVDAVVDDEPIARFFAGSVRGLRFAARIPGTKSQYAMVLAKGNDGLREALDHALDGLRADGTHSRLCTKWFGVDSATK